MRGILAAKKSSKKLRASISQHSEDSASSKEDQRKEDGARGTCYNFKEMEDKCLGNLKKTEGVPQTVINDIKSLFQKYHDEIEKERKGKIKAEAELLYKAQKMFKDLQGATELQDEVKKLKAELKKKDEDLAKLKSDLDEAHRQEQDLIDQKKAMLQKIEQLDRDLDRRQLEDQMKDSGPDIKGKSRESYIKEMGRLKRELDVIEGRLFQSQSDCLTLQKKLQDKEKEYTDMEELVRGHKYEVMKHEQKRKVVETDLERALTTMTDLKRSVSRHYDTFKKAVHELTKKDEENFELKRTLRGLDEQNALMSKYISELRDRLEYLSKVYFELEDQNEMLKRLCSSQTGSLEVIKKKSIDIEKFQDKWIRKLMFVEEKRKAALDESKKLSQDLLLKVKELQNSELVAVKLNKRINELQIEKNHFSQQIGAISDMLKNEKEASNTQHNTIELLSKESENLKYTAKKQESDLNYLISLTQSIAKGRKVKEGKNKLLAAELQTTVKHLLNYQKKINEKDREIKTITSDFNNIVNENNALQSKSTETHGQCKDYELKINCLNSSIANLKQQINLKDDIMEKRQHYIKSIQLDNEQLRDKAKQRKLENFNLMNKITEKEAEKAIFTRLFQKGDLLRLRILKDVDKLQNEVSILKGIIERRNTEICLLYEKTDLMNFMLSNGANEYKQRLQDINLLKTEVSKLRAEKEVLIKKIDDNGNLQKKIIQLQKELSFEKQKCRALEEQMENPINVHRWRILEGKDPDKKELIEKVQALQKIILQGEKKVCVLKEKLHSAEILYSNMKQHMEKLAAGSECATELQEAKRALRNKTLQNQRLAAELAAYQCEYRQAKKEISETKKKSDECLKKYYDMVRWRERMKSAGGREIAKVKPFETSPNGEVDTKEPAKPPDNRMTA